MNFDDYMKKIQYISNILEKNEYAENILNSKELDIAQDFQYICLSSASNYKLVNEIIACLAQNGNSKIVEENVKSISMSMWKDLFDKNEEIKKIFINNFAYIFENTTIITFREIERFINDKETCILIYNILDNIIKKLCTYDRASLISILKNKENGIDKIKQNLESFFQKGEFDISTTYSKILNELSQIPEISKIQILKACNNNLGEMLNRETAIDNETNKLLNWIYDAFEETPMSNEERYIIKQNIDTAILKNFNNILDKSNYDKNTIKILKQFDCTKERFEKNKNHFIEKSNSLNFENQSSNTEKSNSLNIDNQNSNSEAKTTIEKYSLINAYINESCKNDIISTQNQDKCKKDNFDEKIRELITTNIAETDKIIDKVLKKNEAQIKATNNLDVIISEKDSRANNSNIIEEIKNIESLKNVEETKNIESVKNLYEIKDIKEAKNVEELKNIEEVKNVEELKYIDERNIEKIKYIEEKNTEKAKYIEEIKNVEESKKSDTKNLVTNNTEDIKQNYNQSTELIVVKEEPIDTNQKINILKRIFKKITQIFKSKSTIERIGD
ncbi:MAG: hypothetical protein J6K42_03260 [Clostridia bacterium]|nr:hypothetical protein [Clostridia bacterium]